MNGPAELIDRCFLDQQEIGASLNHGSLVRFISVDGQSDNLDSWVRRFKTYRGINSVQVRLRQASFLVKNSCDVESRADVVTAWFPFVTPSPVLPWRLPLTVFSPARLFHRIGRDLAGQGLFFMVNQLAEEKAIAQAIAVKQGFISSASGFTPIHYAQTTSPGRHWWTT